MRQIDYDYIHRLRHLINQYDHVHIDMLRLGESARALSAFQDSAAMEVMRRNALAIKEVQWLGESARLALSAFQDSAAMEAIRQNAFTVERIQWLGESARALSAFQDSAAMEAMRRNTLAIKEVQWLGESARLALSAFQDSAAMEAIRQNAFTVERMQWLGESARLALSAFQDSAAMEAMRRNTLAIKEVQWLGESARLALSAFQDSAAMEAIQQLSNTPFSSSVMEVVFSELDSLDIEELDFIEDQDFSIDEDIELEIQKELEENCDYNLLSEKSQSLLLHIYHKYFLPLFIGCLASIIVTNYQKAQIDLQDKETLADIRSYVRKPILEVNKGLLKGYRVIIGSDVNLRKEPNMRSEIITELPRGKLVEVLDKSKRSWLHVEVDIEGEIFTGWISRRYTTYFK